MKLFFPSGAAMRCRSSCLSSLASGSSNEDSCHGTMRWAISPLSSGSTYALQGTEVLLAQIAADTLLPTKPLMYISESLTGSNETIKVPVIPFKSKRKTKRPYNRKLYKVRDLIKNFSSGRLSNTGPLQLAMTKQQQIFSPLFISSCPLVLP